MHLEFLLEEPSAEAFLAAFLPRILKEDITFTLHPYQGKSDLLEKLPSLLKGYKQWIPTDYRIVVVVDRDDDDCHALKASLEAMAKAARLPTKTAPAKGSFVVLNRVAVEELEAWFLGAPPHLCAEFPRVPLTFKNAIRYRNSDSIPGGTWEALEQLLAKHGYYETGLPKIEVARKMGERLTVSGNSSASFNCFVSGLRAMGAA